MGRLIILIILFFSANIARAQDSLFLTKTIVPSSGAITDFSVDNLGNVYLVINQTQVKKINADGDSLGVFNDTRRFSNISSLDASSALKVLVFYREISTVVVLDRFLAVKNVIDLRKNGIQQAAAVKLSYDNNIWVYDEFDSRIKKIDENGKLLSQSAELRSVFSETPAFESIFDEDRLLYLYDKNQGWYVFDYYGGFVKKYPFINWSAVQVSGKIMTGIVDSFFVSALPGSFDFKQSNASFPAKGIIRMYHRPSNNGTKKQVQYFLLFPGRLSIYAGS